LKSARGITAAILVTSAALALSASAFAGGALTKGYGGSSVPAAVVKQQSGNVKGAVTKPRTTLPQTTVPTSTLPFTGADLGWFALAGGVLVCLGVGLRRAARHHG
jgi:hypothetical protein